MSAPKGLKLSEVRTLLEGVRHSKKRGLFRGVRSSWKEIARKLERINGKALIREQMD